MELTSKWADAVINSSDEKCTRASYTKGLVHGNLIVANNV